MVAATCGQERERGETMRVGIQYACYGTWTLACQQAGLKVEWHRQPGSKEANKVLAINFPNVFPGWYYEIAHPENAYLKDVDIIVGSPPCIGFSSANPAACLEHPSNQEFINMFDFISKSDAKYFVVEIVPNVKKAEYTTIWNAALSKVTGKFRWVAPVFTTSHFHSVQKRTRVYIVGSRDTSVSLGNIFDGLSVGDSITPESVISKFEDEFNNYELDDKIMTKLIRVDGTPRVGMFRLLEKHVNISRTEPVPTITRSAVQLYHYNDKRTLAVPEVAALMGLPDGYNITAGNENMGILQRSARIASGVDVPFTTHLLKYLVNEVFI